MRNQSISTHFSAIVILIVLLAAFASCTGGDELKITETGFEEEISRTENLSFTLNRDVATNEMMNKWDTTAYLQITPPISGRYQWTAANQLTFSPYNPLPPGTDFEVRINSNLSKLTGNKFKASGKVVTFHTPYLQLTQSEVFWQPSRANSQIPATGAKLRFNYEVPLASLAEHLSVEVDGKETPFKIMGTGVRKDVNLEISNEDIEKASKVVFFINAGLPMAGSPSSLKETIKKETDLQPPTELEITGVDTNHDGTEGSVYVNTSQQVVEEGLRGHISITPAIAFHVNYNANGFTVSSENFDAGKTYELSVSQNLRGVFKGKLSEDFKQQIVFGKLEPKITFTGKNATYLGKRGNKNMGLRIVNVPKVKVKITKIFANNIKPFLDKRMEYGWKRHYDDASGRYDYYDYRYYDVEKFGKLVYEAEYETKDLKRNGKVRLLNIDFEDKMPNFEGIYVVEAHDADRMFITDSKVLAYSDLGIIVKKEKDRVYAFVNSIQEAKPISNVEVNFISKTNQVVHSARTDNNGLAVFSNMQRHAPDFEIDMVTAVSGDDFNFMDLNKNTVNAAAFETGGLRPNPSGYEAYLYGDRDLYRPGETVHVSGILRSNQWDTPNKMPVKLKLLLPNGREYKTVRRLLDGQGACETAFDIPRDAVTGTYAVELYTGDDVLLRSQSISVEEFMPDRIKVAIKSSEEVVQNGDAITLSGTAHNLFGPPAVNRNYKVEMSLKRKAFSPKKHPNYTFYIAKQVNVTEKTAEGKTDESGKFTANFDISSKFEGMGLLQGNFFATVFDETGRPVNRQTGFEVYTQDIFYGIGKFDRYASTKQPLDIPIIAVNTEGQSVGQDARLSIVRYEWRTVLESAGRGRYRYRSQRETITELDKTISIKPDGEIFSYTPPKSGSYEVRIGMPGKDYQVAQNFYAYRYGDTENTSFEVNQEGEVSMEFDKESYQVGETANILFKTPFEGRLLVSIERDEVMRHLYVDTDKKAKQISFEVTKDHVPNVYVSATLIRPMRDLGVPLTVAHGYAPLMVENPKNQLPLEIAAVEKSRSKTKQNIKIKTAPNANVTLAVVDEGILQIKNYETPNPYDHFYQKRALDVSSHDIYPYLFPEMVASGALTGGDKGFDLSKRTNPMKDKRVKLVSHWSGILKSDAKGNINQDIDIPQFSGDLRIMAVAYKDEKFAGAHTNMKVADPVVVSTGLPRFLSPEDEVAVPVTLSNTTTDNANAKVRLQVEGPLQVVGEASQNLELAANGENRTEFRVKALPQIGIGKVTAVVEAMNETFSEEIEIGVRPASSLQKKSGSGSAKAGETLSLNDMRHNYFPESVDGKLIVSRSPLAEFASDLDYLVGYPHGCVEQTISRAFPQIYYHELVKSTGKNAKTATGQNSNNPHYNVQQAINKLQAMQLNDGGMAYWRGGREANWWGSVLAAHFLWEAKEAGFDVPETTMKPLTRFLKKRLKKRETFVYYYYDANGKEQHKEIASKEIPYTLYVLALMGEPDQSLMNYYKSKSGLLSMDGKYLLACTYAITGSNNGFVQVLPASFDGERSKAVFGGSFYSPIRDRALALNALLTSNPDHQQVGVMTKHLITDFKKKRYKNTQERLFTLLALGKIAKMTNEGNPRARVEANGKLIGNFDGSGDLVLNYADWQGAPITLKTEGDGKLFYFWELEGLDKNGDYVEEDSFLKVRRSYFDRFGRAITNNEFTQNDLVVVKLSLQSTGSDKVENVVVSDILPAGLEVENPRISDLPDMEWIKDASHPEHRDFRDDRVHLFTTATNKPKNFYYVLRAVSPGNYVMGPASADAMYNGEYHSYHGAGSVRVLNR